VGVKIPVFMPPMMMMGINKAQKALTVSCTRLAKGKGVPAGRSILRSCSFQATIRPAPIIRPGTMPDMNKAEMEVLVVTP